MASESAEPKTGLAPSGFVDLGDQQLEYRLIGPAPEDAPTIVMLHEGLGCLGLWGDFPQKLAQATGLGVFVYSRAGYGGSSAVPLPRPLTYMHEEARDTLPRLLGAIGFRRGALLGHSDGASIAAIYAGSQADPRLVCASLIAPHFLVEDFGLCEIAKARDLYRTTDLRAKLARWHKHVDVAFCGWNDAWLDPGFRQWDLTSYLPSIRIPMQVVQGEDDLYGTRRHVDLAIELSGGPVETQFLPGMAHSPHRQAPEQTLTIVADFFKRRLSP